MRTRSERLMDAEEAAEDAPLILSALALNRQPMRRAYFIAVTETEEKLTVKTLARLANAGAVAPTEGLTFEIADKELAEDVLAKTPDDIRKTLHQRSLDYAVGKKECPPRFIVHHSLGLGEYVRAAELLIAEIPSADAERAKDLATGLKECLTGLWAIPEVDRTLVEKVGVALLKYGEPTLRPREFKEWVERMRTLPLVLESLAVVEDAVRARAARKEQEKSAPSGAEKSDGEKAGAAV